MLFNHLKVALRHLAQNRLFSVLNVLGLSVGMGTGVLVLLWVQQQYNQYAYPDAARIFRVNAHLKSGSGTNSSPYSSAAVAPHGLAEVPELEGAVRISQRPAQTEFRFDGKLLVEKNAAYVDSTFFKFFQLELVAGDPNHPFSAINSLVLTESTARKFFGDANPLGKMVQRGPNLNDRYVVSGVMRDWPAHAGFDYTYLLNFARINAYFRVPGNEDASYDDTWGQYSVYSFVKLQPNAAAAAAEQKLDAMNRRNNPTPSNEARLSLQPIHQIALYDPAGNDTGAQTARIFLFAALFILGIACINYINLSTAQATRRAREVGMRKVAGAQKSQLIGQFLLESGLITGVAFLIGLCFVHAALPFCNNFLGQSMVLDLDNPTILKMLAGSFVGVFLLSGLYPALLLSHFQPVNVLKGALKTGSLTTQWLRRGLVVVQFGLSVLLLAGTLTVGRQLDFLQHRDVGFGRDHVFSFNLRPGTQSHKAAIVAELEKLPGVESVAQMGAPVLGAANTASGDWDGKPVGDNVNFDYFNTDKNLLKALKINLVAGEWFTGTAADSNKYILNETAVRAMGIQDPIGKRFSLGGTGSIAPLPNTRVVSQVAGKRASLGGNGVIVGVVQDCNFNSAHEAIRPACFYSRPDQCPVLYVRAQASALPEAVSKAGELWKQYEALPFEYQFLDAEFDKLYRTEQRTSGLFNIFSGIALLIACIGLFGLASFTAARRTKEIGVRKVLGASVVSVTNLLIQDFVKLVLVAVAVATPAAYFLIERWLADFAYRIDFQWWVVALAGALALLVALLTVGFQSVKAALANPVQSLRNE